MNQQTAQPPSRWSPRQIMLATLFIVFVLFTFWLLFRFRTVVLLLFIAVLLGTGIKPAVNWLAQRGVPRGIAPILVYLLLIALLVAFLLLLLPVLLEQGTTIFSQLSDYYNDLRLLMVRSPSELIRDLGVRLSPFFNVEDLMQTPEPAAPPPGDIVEAPAAETVDAVGRLFTYLRQFGRGLFFVFASTLLSFYWVLEGDRAVRSLLLLAPVARRENLRDLFGAVEGRLGGFLLGQALLCVVVGVLALVAYLLIGLPNALVLALIAGVLEAVPTLGPILGAIPALLVASTVAPDKIVWVLVATFVIQMLENNLLVPRVMDRSVGVHPLLTLLAMATLSSLMGLIGALLAVPLAAIFQLLLNRLLVEPIKEESLQPEGRDYLSYLRLQAQEVAQDARKLLSRRQEEDGDNGEAFSEEEAVPQEGDIEESIEALANELDRILESMGPAAEEARQP